jgi:hypothetical protein
MVKEGVDLDKDKIIKLLNAALQKHIHAIKTENLYIFDGKRGHALGQG